MNRLVVLMLVCVGCTKSTIDVPCAPNAATLVGVWELSATKTYGGCCPRIPDTGWKTVSTNEAQKLTFGNNVLIIKQEKSLLTTTYTTNKNTISLEQNILGQMDIWKDITIVQMTKSELIIILPVGWEGEQEEMLLKRICE